MVPEVKTDTTIISARAICTVCDWTAMGGRAPQAAVEHVKQTGHSASLNTNAFTTVQRRDG